VSDVVSARVFGTAVAQYQRNRFSVYAKAKQHRRNTAPKGVSTMPAVAQHWPDFAPD